MAIPQFILIQPEVRIPTELTPPVSLSCIADAFTPDGGDGVSTVTFKSETEVLNYIGAKILLPIWKDPVCGDGNCEWPWEYPAWGPFGCQVCFNVQNQASDPLSARKKD